MDRQEFEQRRMAYGKPYPVGRHSHWYHRFSRTLFKTCAALQVEAKGVLLLILISSLEDAKHRTGAVLFTDEQMRPLLGMNEKTLIRVRQKCVEHGWLHFEAGMPGVPSRYWTEVPVAFQGHSNDLLDEEYSWCRNDTNTDTKFGTNTDTKFGTNTDTKFGTNTDTKNGSTVFPVPIANPSPSPAWTAAEAAVRGTGVSNWRQSVVDSRKHGLRPQDVLDLVAWWQGHQTEFSRPLGALCYALRNADPLQREDWGKAFPRKPEAVQRPLAAQGTQSASTADDPLRAREDRLRQLEFDFEAEVRHLTIPEIVTKFELPAELQTKLSRYPTWAHTRNADSLRIEVLSIVEKKRLAS